MDQEQDGVSLLVTGSRSIKDPAVVFARLDAFVSGNPELRVTRLIHGGAVGVDTLAGQWAAARDIMVTVVRPDFKQWPVSTYRWKAYTVRDYQMVDMCDQVVAIWDGKSSGTRLTFEYAERKQKRVALHRL